MSRRTADVNSPASAAGQTGGRHLSTATASVGILLALALAVLTLRLFRLGDIPPGALLDEGIHGVNALQVLRGEHTVFFPEKHDGLEGLMAYAVALTTTLFGRTVLALRLPAAVASTGTVFAVFWLGWLLFREVEPGQKANPWRGIFVGGVGAALLAASLGQTIIGRTAFRANFLPLLLAISFALVWWSWRRQSLWPIAVAGVCASLLPYTYLAAHFSPILYLLFGFSFLTCPPSATGKRLAVPLPRIHIVRLCLFAGVATLVAAPILIYFASHPDDFFSRSNQVSIFSASRNLGNVVWLLLINVWEHLLAFGVLGDRYWSHNLPGRPMLNAVEALMFWLGVAVAVSRWRQPSYRLLLLWLVVMLMPAMLARDSVPNTLRMIGAVPSIYLLAATGAWEIWQVAKKQLLRRDAFRMAATIGAMIPGVLLFKGWNTHRIYFHEWAPAYRVLESYEVEWTELTRTLNALPFSPGAVYLIADGQRQQPLIENFRSHTFDYLYQGETPAYLFHTAMPDFAQRIQSTLIALEELSTVNVVEWNLKSVWTGDENERFAFLLGKYGRYRESEDFGRFRVHRYTDISLDTPWKPYDFLEPLPVIYDGGIELVEVALGHGQEQLSIEEPVLLRGSRDIWTVLRWQTTPDLGIEYSVSLRLLSAEMTDVYTKDLILWKPDHSVTGDGGPAEQFDTWIHLDVPADIPPGEYELRLIVYDSETLKPTVEIGVWEPETTLAHLHVVAGQ